MKLWLKWSAIGLSLAYPFWVYWGLQLPNSWPMLAVIVGMVVFRCLSGISASERNVLIVAVLGVVLTMLLWGEQLGLKFYPVMMNAGFLLVFAGSLLYPPTMVERIAKLAKSETTPQSIRYMRQVTLVWALFFLANGTVALYTAVWGSSELWLLYNGCLSYILIGVLAGGEWLVRQRVMRN